MVSTVEVPAATADPPRPDRRWALLVAAGCALVAVLGGALLPFAPVAVSTPSVSWPREPGRPESTVLALTAYRPLALDVRFGCAVARLAGGTPDGLLVATTRPGTGPGLQVSVRADRLRVTAAGRVLLDEPVPGGPCEYRIRGHSDGRPSFLAGPPSPAGRLDSAVPLGREPPPPDRFARPDNAELVVERDGGLRAAAAVEQLPDVDLLLTSLGPLPAGPEGLLAVELRLDDEFGGRPTPLKIVLIVLVAAAVLGAGLAALVADRARPRLPRIRCPHWVDALVPAVLVGWLFVAPATDDDGWFATQARNAAPSGDIGSYYQLYDLSFTPFTWLYHGLSHWQLVAGTAPVAQRIPALVCGLLTWWVLRRVAAAAAPDAVALGGRRLAAALPLGLAVVYLAWWLPYDMGVRPEGVVAFFAAATLLAVLAAGRGGRLAVAWLACVLAGAGAVTHTTGVIMLGPLLAGWALLWPVLHRPGDRLTTGCRALVAGCGLAVAPLLGFADGALRDVRRAQTITDSLFAQDGWADELERYVFLLDPIPMGSYARRAAVLACLLGLAWYGVLAVGARARGVVVPGPLRCSAGAAAIGFAALALAPSKWTHHFGALAGTGSAFLALLLVLAVPLTRRALAGARLPRWAVGLVAGSAVLALALAWRGPNSWPYAWLDGVRTPYLPPAVLGVRLGQPWLWAALLGVLVAVLVRTGRGDRRLRVLTAVPLLVLGSLAASSGYLVGSFGSAAVRGVPAGSLWAQGLADPAGVHCGTAGAVRVLDPDGGRPLVDAGLAAPAAPVGFVVDGASAGQLPVAGPVWDSRGGPGTGSVSSGWFALPVGLPADAAVTVLAAGTLDQGNALTATYGRRPAGGGARGGPSAVGGAPAGSSTVGGAPAGSEPARAAGPDGAPVVVPAGAQPLTDTGRSAAWRTFRLTPPPGADLVRLDAVDASTAEGWLAFTPPAVRSAVPLQQLLGPGPVALGWQLAFGFPCQRPPTVRDGVTEPARYAVARGEQHLSGLTDLAWQPSRGGVFGPLLRSRPVLQLATVEPVDPYLQVYRFGDGGLRDDGYRLRVATRTVAGHDTAPGLPAG